MNDLIQFKVISSKECKFGVHYEYNQEEIISFLGLDTNVWTHYPCNNYAIMEFIFNNIRTHLPLNYWINKLGEVFYMLEDTNHE